MQGLEPISTTLDVRVLTIASPMRLKLTETPKDTCLAEKQQMRVL